MLESYQYLDLDHSTWQLNNTDLNNALLDYGHTLWTAPANSDFFHNREMQFQHRINEVHNFKTKWQTIADQCAYEDTIFTLRRMLRNKEKAVERLRLHSALREANELVDAINKLKDLINHTPGNLFPAFQASVKEFFLEAEQLAYTFLDKQKLQTFSPEIKSERTLLTEAVLKATAVYREPFNLQHFRDLIDCTHTLPAYKLGWKSFVVKHSTLVSVSLGILTAMATLAIAMSVGYACAAAGFSFAATVVVEGSAGLVASQATSRLAHGFMHYAYKRSDQELLLDSQIKTKTQNVVSTLRRYSLYQMQPQRVEQEYVSAARVRM
jgi:hypothetical protein